MVHPKELHVLSAKSGGLFKILLLPRATDFHEEELFCMPLPRREPQPESRRVDFGLASIPSEMFPRCRGSHRNSDTS